MGLYGVTGIALSLPFFLSLMTWGRVSGIALALSTVLEVKPSLDKRRSEMLTNREQPCGEWQEVMKLF
jgi:hypothetical protein